jgi:TatD DNase family protein
MLIDTHAHVNFRSFKDDAKETLQRALDNGVQVINIGSQIDTSRQAVELANQFEQGVYAVVGLHPEHTHSQYVDEEETHFKSREEDFDYEMYKKLAENPKVVGIGECGLDYYRLPGNVDHQQIKEKQKEVFKKQVKLAKELNKVLVIHSRPAKGDESLYNDLLGILDKYLIPTTPQPSAGPLLKKEGNTAAAVSPPDKGEYPERQSRGEGVGVKLRFEIHSYTGSPEYLQKFLDRGAYVSFNGIVTFDKTGNMEKLVRMTPLDRMLLETDCPYLSPVPMRGKRNEPQYVQYVAQRVAELKGMAPGEVAERTTENARSLFRL